MEAMRGEQALVEVLAANDIALVAGVYGDPCTSLLDALAEAGMNVEISIEEKTAMAQALGASVVGKRAVVVTKHVGMNVASDPLITAATHGIGAAVLILAGDDPGAEKSQNEQDSRWYAKIAEIPVLTPSSPDHLSRSACEGIELSEELGIPVMIQVTARLLQREGEARSHTAKSRGHFDRQRPWGNLILDRYKLFYRRIYPKMIKIVENSKLHEVFTGDSLEGVISCGFVSSLVRHKNHFALGYAHPLPTKRLIGFLQRLERVLIVEEIAPIVENDIRSLVGKEHLQVEVLGRLSGHLPRIGRLEKEHIDRAFDLSPVGLNLDVQATASSSILDLPCGGFELLYEALDEILAPEDLVAGDVGCSILHGYLSPQVIDTAFALGTSIGTASGMSLSSLKGKGIAIIGDAGFLHSGISGLLNAVEQDHNVLVIILYNRISAMTPGRQEIKGLERMRKLVEACGPKRIDEIDMESATKEQLKDLLRKRLTERGVQVVIAQAKPSKLIRSS